MSKNLFLLSFVFAPLALATEISGALTYKDIKESSRILAWGSYHRSWTAASIAPDAVLGLQLGLDSSFVYQDGLLNRGDGAGVAPRVIPVPRLWAAWDFPLGFKSSFSYSPGDLYDGISAYGTALQWGFLTLPEAAFSALLGYTYSDAFGDLKSHTFNLDFQASRNLGLWEPYAGIGFMSANSTAAAKRIAPGETAGPFTVAAFHAFIGVEVRMPAKLAFQLDIMNTKPTFALILGQAF